MEAIAMIRGLEAVIRGLVERIDRIDQRIEILERCADGEGTTIDELQHWAASVDKRHGEEDVDRTGGRPVI